MTEDELVSYIKTLQEAVRNLKEQAKSHHQTLLDLWGAQKNLLDLINDHRRVDNEQFRAQINILLLFMTLRLSTSSEFADFLSDLVEANTDAQESSKICEVAKGLLDAGFNKHLAADAAQPQAPSRTLPDNVIIFPLKPSSPPSMPTPPPQTPED